MTWKTSPEILGLVGALIISTLSGIISISQRILKGHKASMLWVISEYLTAVLAGTLMYYSYPSVQPSLPEWVTLPFAVAVMAHSGGRIFQEAEKTLLSKYPQFLK